MPYLVSNPDKAAQGYLAEVVQDDLRDGWSSGVREGGRLSVSNEDGALAHEQPVSQPTGGMTAEKIGRMEGQGEDLEGQQGLPLRVLRT